LGAKATIKALQLGAVDFIPKPSGAKSLEIATISEEIINKVKTDASAHVIPPPDSSPFNYERVEQDIL
jgi:two-component system chemotaxis response regulator CheB